VRHCKFVINVLVNQLLGRSFQIARNFTTSSHQKAGFSIWVFKNFRRWYPRTLTTGGGDPLPHPTPSPAFGRARGASAPVLGHKPWSPLSFQPWLRPWGHFTIYTLKMLHSSHRQFTLINRNSHRFLSLKWLTERRDLASCLFSCLASGGGFWLSWVGGGALWW